jgi:uncharacterized repeat protein (TIGR03806 family)
MIARAVIALLLAASGACAGDAADDGNVRPAPIGSPWQTLAAWRLFSDAPRQVPNARVESFEVISPLFSDYSAKHRFMWIPEGGTIGIPADATAPWELPVGSIVVKTFGYLRDMRDPSLGEKLVETRLLVREPEGWVPHTYVWDDAQATATLKVAGASVPVSWIDPAGTIQSGIFFVPNTNECQDCHGTLPATRLLGVKTAQLDRDGLNGDGQLARLHAHGLLASVPAEDHVRFAAPDEAGAELTLRARSYLDANCAHCHSAVGDAASKALYLDFANTDPASDPDANWGACKIPTSAGGATCGDTYDVVPGDPDHSIMICRMNSTQCKDQMPPLGRRIVHTEGIALIREWIANMPGTCASRTP